MLRSLLILVLAALLLWALALVALYLAGRRDTARALATFLPDSLILVRRLLRDPALSRSRKLALWALLWPGPPQGLTVVSRFAAID